MQLKITVAVFVLVGAVIAVVAHEVFDELRPRYHEAVEETLIDTAQLLAAQLASDFHEPAARLNTERLQNSIQNLERRRFSARINDALKERVDLRFSVSDAQGIVVFDSRGLDVGKDHSKWNDVYLTLRGQYGARSTRDFPDNPESSVLYVAAPILVDGELRGVVTVGKAVSTVAGFIQGAKARVVVGLSVLAVLAFVLSWLVTNWITRPVNKLTRYIRSLTTSSPEKFPELPNDEVGELGRTFEEMRTQLEGKAYVERYVHNLTHEIKTPLSAIVGAAEILREEKSLDPTARRLVDNMDAEARRLHDIAERILELASLENRSSSLQFENFDLVLLVDEVMESFGSALKAHGIELRLSLPQSLSLLGERFLVWRALANLMQNAIDFAPAGSTIEVLVDEASRRVEIRDEGPGLPEYAEAKVFDKFFSLERPRNLKKSSGLGLSFVREVMQQHGGEVRLSNRTQGGALAALSFTKLG